MWITFTALEWGVIELIFSIVFWFLWLMPPFITSCWMFSALTKRKNRFIIYSILTTVTLFILCFPFFLMPVIVTYAVYAYFLIVPISFFIAGLVMRLKKRKLSETSINRDKGKYAKNDKE
ncbi:MAG: hypothetical protein ACTSUL_07305 [Promethearchaeota archaeon]